MAIDFQLSEGSRISQQHYHDIAEAQMRPISRKYDLAEHTLRRGGEVVVVPTNEMPTSKGLAAIYRY